MQLEADVCGQRMSLDWFIAVTNLLGAVSCNSDCLFININCLNRAVEMELDCVREQTLGLIDELPCNFIPEHSQVRGMIRDWNGK